MTRNTQRISVTRRSTLVPLSDAALIQAACSVLGDRYDLSIVICGDARARSLNRTYRNKQSASNVLSFPLSASSGEIFLNAARIRREAGVYGHSPRKHMLYLLIHGCLHLKGYSHGSTMEKAEQTYLTRCTIR
jgi:probable rRNA maturation factor